MNLSTFQEDGKIFKNQIKARWLHDLLKVNVCALEYELHILLKKCTLLILGFEGIYALAIFYLLSPIFLFSYNVCQPEKSKFLLTEYTHSHLDPFARDDSS
jgi:hypothetical protein